MNEERPDIIDVDEWVREGSRSPIQTMAAYREHWARAEADPDGYWLAQAKQRVQWRKQPSYGLEGNFSSVRDSPIAWFGDGELNVTESCLDRHLETRADKTAILWEGDEPGDTRSLSYRELHEAVCRCANALRELGLEKGERAIIYMGMVPEAAIAMLACARLGAVHSVVFGGFSAEALRDRVRDCGASLIITQDVGKRGSKNIPLKQTTNAALEGEHGVRKVLVFQRDPSVEVEMKAGRDLWWHEAVDKASPSCEAVCCAAEDPLFILYTSGSTGRPKGLVHTCGGYLTWTAYTHAVTFDLREDDVYACVADVGWITGHSYIVYGPLCNGATSLMFESIPTYPEVDRYWDMVERHKISVFYTAPTAIRVLAAHGEGPVRKHDLSSLRVLGTVGEPIDPAAWRWYHEVVGQGRCAVVDTWWQTETGGHCITPIAPATPAKPGSATLPVPGIMPMMVDAEGAPQIGPAEGRLCIVYPWPGMARTVWGDHGRYVATYFDTFKSMYFTGDGARRDSDGYYWITGRVDDVLNISGHRMGTAEFESALIAIDEIAEAAVVGYPHPVKGQGVHAYAVLQPDAGDDLDAIGKHAHAAVREAIGAHARIDRLQFVPGLPKTRSGKCMRRILRKIAEGEPERLGDVSTLADPSVVEVIVEGAKPFTSR
ncbi:acetate--CoA ligase [Pseudenhygromyxa sp. WMMC2535]|uniref:acetate--CoA ligase n=1 Tax=Pseudenhygromyxa sp. WMMC2535 TaxID=2712867 RepID=UPI0015534C5D|nr:acetate--CoA ligase [Pseudenhygromyxa sp. WMMC2535]NVB39330.1 acetate--CoA ligase [Pseudenhygromyxa sp. WMMC2535]